MQIEKVDAGSYRIAVISGKEKNIIAEIDSLEKAACVIRFIFGSNIKGDEYMLAVKTMREIDAREGGVEGAG